MSRRLIISRSAREDILRATEWYEEREAGLSGEFLRAVDAMIAAVVRSPLQYPILDGTARRAILRRFPYSLLFRATEETVVILSCPHWRRKPRRWGNDP